MCPGLGVDSRLYDAGLRPRRRPGVLRRDDIPRLTLALIAVVRKRGRAKSIRIMGVEHVRITTPEGDIAVLRTDWDRIEPLIVDGVFDSQQVPVRQAGVYLHPFVVFDEPVLNWADRPLYYRILGQLSLIFTEPYPTSEL